MTPIFEHIHGIALPRGYWGFGWIGGLNSQLLKTANLARVVAHAPVRKRVPQKATPTYVINLESSHERRAVMRAHLDAIAVPFQFFDAIDGRKMTRDALMAAAPNGGVDYCGMLTAAEIGCALSHLLAIRQIAEGKDEYGAVLEDDVFVLPEGHKFFDQQFLGSLPAFDILQLAGVDSRQKSRRALSVGNIGGYQFCALPRCHYSMGGLIYTREAARLISVEITKITAPIDNMIFYDQRIMGLRIIEVRPVLLRSNADVPSDIGFRRGPDRFLSKVERELRRFRNLTRRWRSFARVWGLSSIIRLRPTYPELDPALRRLLPRIGKSGRNISRSHTWRPMALSWLYHVATSWRSAMAGVVPGSTSLNE